MGKKNINKCFNPILFFISLCFAAGILEFGARVAGLGPLKQYRFSQTRLFEYEPNQHALTNFNGKKIYINSLGIREDEIPLKKPSGVFRILVIGDSTSFGFSLDKEETYAKQLEHKLNANSKNKKFEVINAAVNRYDMIQERILLEEVGIKYEPDLVLVGFSLNDITDREYSIPMEDSIPKEILETYERSLKRMYLIKHSAVLSRMWLLYNAYSFGRVELSKIEAKFMEYAVRDEETKKLKPLLEKSWERAIQEYLKMQTIGRIHGFNVAIVHLPYHYTLKWPSGKYDRPQLEFLRFQQQAGISFIDPLPALKESKKNVFLKNDPIHMNADGFEIVADVIFKNLKQNSVVE